MDLNRIYVKKGVLYIKRQYLKVGDKIYAEHDLVAECWRWDKAQQMIENNEEFVCGHCGVKYIADWEMGASSWVYLGVCEECEFQGEFFCKDEVCLIGRVFAREGGRVPDEEITTEDLFDIVLN